MRRLVVQRIANIGGMFTAIFATIYSSKAFLSQPEGIAVVWPAAGLVFAALVQSPRSRWCEVLLAAVAANALGDYWLLEQSWPVIGALCVANALESVLAATIVRALVPGRLALDRMHQAFALLVAAARRLRQSREWRRASACRRFAASRSRPFGCCGSSQTSWEFCWWVGSCALGRTSG